MLIILVLNFATMAQEPMKSSGIGLRGSFYRMTGATSQIVIKDHDYYSSVNLGGFGASLFLFSRLNETLWLEITMGAIGRVNAEQQYYDENEVDVTAINPLLLGIRYQPMVNQIQSNLSPYVSMGGGPYWISDIHVSERNYGDDEVNINTYVKHGGYLGGGLNFGVSDCFAINFDLKYHFVDLSINHDKSGFEYGIGAQIMWGKFKR